ncbi:MAG: hypothetical protein IPO85_18785 [Saprospiraceae bacterium]|uniref:Lipoprotein n=1 Tax=Candidatus Defluviibacterium haderslevense TaxID=2981993 RepID=A0A9D7SBD1_9BACT|nr:hypothetical protein [Candidatus Defluviibacterium haderslevense]
MKRYSHLIFTIVLFSCNELSCDAKKGKREPIIDSIEGEHSWFSKTKIDTMYFLNTFISDKRDTIEFPPKQLEREVDISLDVTGSVFQKTIKFNDTIISLAEYNVIKLCKFFEENNILKAGDDIILRLFGSHPNGKNIQLDKSLKLSVSKIKIDLEVKRFSRKYMDMKLIVHAINKDSEINDIILKIKKWSIENVLENKTSNEKYTTSPFLEYIHNIHSGYKENKGNINKERLYIFVTDGHFYVDDFEFKPSNYQTYTITALKETIKNLKIFPTFDSTDNASIVFIGLNSEGNNSYFIAQKVMLSWFLSPLQNVQFYSCENLN